jgi:hypothetical protein
MKLVSFITVAFFPLAVNAQTRGGTCQSAICDVTGGIVGLILLTLLLVSLSASIAKHGFWKGIFKHAAIQVLALYLTLIGGLVLLVLLGRELFGEFGLLVSAGLIFLIPTSKRKKRK